MRAAFGHFGDAVEAVREIYEGTRERATKRRLLTFMRELTELQGDYENLRGFWPGFEAIAERQAREDNRRSRTAGKEE